MDLDHGGIGGTEWWARDREVCIQPGRDRISVISSTTARTEAETQSPPTSQAAQRVSTYRYDTPSVYNAAIACALRVCFAMHVIEHHPVTLVRRTGCAMLLLLPFTGLTFSSYTHSSEAGTSTIRLASHGLPCSLPCLAEGCPFYCSDEVRGTTLFHQAFFKEHQQRRYHYCAHIQQWHHQLLLHGLNGG